MAIEEQVNEKMKTVSGGYILFYEMLNRGGDWNSKVAVKKILEPKDSRMKGSGSFKVLR